MSTLPVRADHLGLPLSPSLRSRRRISSRAPPPLAISAGKASGGWCRLKAKAAELDDVSGYGVGAGESETVWDDSEIGLGRRRKESGDWEHLINESSQWLMALILGGAVVWKHDAQILWTAAGALLNAWSSLGLKLMLNEERPAASLSSSPGMPSSHAQSLFYGIVVLLDSLFQWLGISAFSIIIGILIVTVGSYLSWLRISQQSHTISQVVVGAVLGTLVSAAWIYIWHAILLDACVSFLWVRIAVISGSICFCLSFFFYFIKYWIPRDG